METAQSASAGTAKKLGTGIPVPMAVLSMGREREFALRPFMEAVRSGGDLQNIGGSGPYTKDIVCPDGCVMFRMTAKKLGNENFYKGKFFD